MNQDDPSEPHPPRENRVVMPPPPYPGPLYKVPPHPPEKKGDRGLVWATGHPAQPPQRPVRQSNRKREVVAACVVAAVLLMLTAALVTALARLDGVEERAASAASSLVAERDALVADLQRKRVDLETRANDAKQEMSGLRAENEELRDRLKAEEPEPAPGPEPAPEPGPAPADPLPLPADPPALPSEPEPALTAGQENSLRSAQQYLGFSGFSRTGLIEQLEYEGYSTADAIWAVDNVGANWQQEAVESADNYLSFSSFSRQGLIDQLMYEGFTAAQAEHGVSQTYDG